MEDIDKTDSVNYINANGDEITILTLQEDNISSDEIYIDASEVDKKTINGVYGIEDERNGYYGFSYLNGTKYVEIQVSNENYLKEIIPQQKQIKENLTYGNLTLELPEGFTNTTDEIVPSVLTSLFGNVGNTETYNYKNIYGEFISIYIFNNTKIFDNIDDTWTSKTINGVDGYFKSDSENVIFFTYQKDSKVIEIRTDGDENYLNEIVN